MSTALHQIQEAEKNAEKVLHDAEKKAHEIILEAEEKSHASIKDVQEAISKDNKSALMNHKEECAKKIEEAEKVQQEAQAEHEKKWKKNVEAAADILVDTFLKRFS